MTRRSSRSHELFETIFGARRPDTGTVTLDGHRITGVGTAVRHGMGLDPDERKSQALLLDEPVFKAARLAGIDVKRHTNNLATEVQNMVKGGITVAAVLLQQFRYRSLTHLLRRRK